MLYTFSSVPLLSLVQLFVTLWTAARHASLSLTISWSSPKFMSIESVMLSNHLFLCLLLLLPPIFPQIKVFSNELTLCIRWPKYWSFSFSISPSNEYSGFIPLNEQIGMYYYIVKLEPLTFNSVNSGNIYYIH